MYLFQEELAFVRRQDSLREARKRAVVAEARRARRSHRRARREHRLFAFGWTRSLSALLRTLATSERGVFKADSDDCRCEAS
jgi:hypothetical protein